MDDDLQDPSRGPKAFQSVEQDTQSLAQRLAELMRALAAERLRAEGLQKATKVSLCDACSSLGCLALWLWVCTSWPRRFQGGQGEPQLDHGCFFAVAFALRCAFALDLEGMRGPWRLRAVEGKQGSSCQLLALALPPELPFPWRIWLCYKSGRFGTQTGAASHAQPKPCSNR